MGARGEVRPCGRHLGRTLLAMKLKQGCRQAGVFLFNRLQQSSRAGFGNCRRYLFALLLLEASPAREVVSKRPCPLPIFCYPVHCLPHRLYNLVEDEPVGRRGVQHCIV